MIIKGLSQKDDNFITVYADNTIYTKSRRGGACGWVKVGQRMENGFVLTQKLFNKWARDCDKIRTIEIKEVKNNDRAAYYF